VSINQEKNEMQQTLSIPHHRDPVARVVLMAIVLAPVWLGLTSLMSPATAREQTEPVMIVVTPTLPATAPTVAPAAPMLAAPTAAVTVAVPPRPTVAPAPTEVPAIALPAPLVAPTEPPAPQAPHIGERASDKAPPGPRLGPPNVMPER
jgi:eukaryotic-like serine/threonine-protein kinase